VVSGTDVSRFQYQVDRLGQRTAVTESLPPQSRTVNYSYDGLLRLTGAAENPGTTYAYAYDLAGNRTEVRVNGAVTESRSYDATDQVTGWQYDAAGNLLSDGATTYTYDALNRALTTNAGSETRSYSYNGDGTLLQQTANGVTTSYAQDLATQESQVLQTTQGTTTTLYLYGADRLAAVSGPTRSWYVEDGIGSVRRTLDDAGAVLTTLSYDPWGTPQGSTAPTTFGYTGELHDAVTGLVNLRVRWYQPGQARFLTRDPFGGVPERPETLAPYPYAEDSPIDKTDPSGNLAIFVAGFFGPRPRTGPDRPDIWKMADRFERFIRGNTRRFDPDTQMQVIHEVESVRKNAPRCRPNDKRCNSKREPIILIGHSRGAATIQSAVFALRHYDPNIRIDLIITLGMIPFNISQPVGGVNYAAKVSNVDRHINFRSRYRSLFSSPNNDIIFAERAVKGSEEWYIKEAEHANLDDEFIGKDKKYPNLVWPVTEVAIHRIQQDAEKPLGYVPGGMSKPIITLRKRRF
jgi:RHS repeat-associated protein